MAETLPYHGARADAATAHDGRDTGEPVTAFDETLPSAPGGATPGEGTQVGRYVIDKRIGAGGMGVVYRAHDPELKRVVALKLLKATRSTGLAAQRRRKRLLREARAMAQLSHPNVIPVYDVGEYDDGLYVAMEFVEGSNARQWLKAVAPPWRRTLGVFRAAGRGLAAAHNAGLVHRDFKPANVMVGDDGRVRVLDFGLARAVVDEPDTDVDADTGPPAPPEIDGHWSETLTADGTILGTPIYMAPEQYAGKPADARTDQYSFCVALYEALYGHLPFKPGSVKQQAQAKYRGEIVEIPLASKVPRRLYHAMRKGLSPRPDDRFESMPALLRELRSVHEERTEEPAAWRGWAVVSGVVTVAAALVMSAGPSRSPSPASTPAVVACPTAEAAFGEAWNEARRERGRQAFAGSGVAGAEARWAEVEEALDEQVAQWGAQYDRACADRQGPDERHQRLHRARLACLERHRDGLDVFVEVLAEPTATTVHRAASAAQGLPSLEACEDDVALLSAAVRDEGARAPRMAALDREIGRTRALRLLGRLDEARPVIDVVIEQAGGEDLRPVTGRALLERAHLRRSADDLAAAELDLRAAYFNAVADRRARVAATAAIGLVDVLAARGNTDAALAWSQHARAQLDALDPAQGLDAALRQALTHVGAASTPEVPTPPTPDPTRAEPARSPD